MNMDSNDDMGFDHYVATTVDPGPAMLVATIVFCALCLAIIPCLVSLANRCDRRRRDGDDTVEDLQSPSTYSYISLRLIGSGTNIKFAGEQEADQDVESDGSTLSNNDEDEGHIHAVLGGAQNLKRMDEKEADDDLEAREEQETGNIKEGHSLVNESSMGDVNHDDVSFHDAIDDDSDDTDDSDVRRYYQRWERTHLSNSLDTLLAVAEWDYETNRICKLGFPFVIQAFITGSAEAARVSIIGRLIGTNEVTAYLMVVTFVGLTATFVNGFTQSLTTVCSQAIGANNNRLAGQYVQLCVVMYIVVFLPFMIFWYFYMDNTLMWLGFDEKIVSSGDNFTLLYVFVSLVSGLSAALHSLLNVIDLEDYSMYFGVGQEIVASILVLLVALGPHPTLQQVGYVYLFENCLGIFINISIIMWNGWFDKYLSGMIGSCALRNVKAIQVLLITSVPLSLGGILEYGEWQILTIFASFMGPAEVAAWGLVGTLWGAVEYVTQAVADAGEVRCAFLLGAGMPNLAKISSYKSIFLASFVSLFISSCVFILGDNIAVWMTNDTTLQRMVADLIPYFGLGNISLSLGTMSWTLVGAQGRYWLSTAVGFAGSWLVTLPLCALFTIALGFDLQAQTAAIVVGYMVTGTVNSFFLFRTNWKKQSRVVIANHETPINPPDSDTKGATGKSLERKSNCLQSNLNPSTAILNSSEKGEVDFPATDNDTALQARYGLVRQSTETVQSHFDINEIDDSENQYSKSYIHDLTLDANDSEVQDTTNDRTLLPLEIGAI